MKQIETELVIASVGRRGDGVAAMPGGKPVYVMRALPGEKVRVRLKSDLGDAFSARLLAVLEPSPVRVDAPCPWYERCGGCSLQHWEGGSYRAWKADRIRAALEQAGLVPGAWLPPVFVPQGTRRRATLAAVMQNGKLRLGYHRMRSHDIVDVPDCLLLAPRLQETVQAMRPYLPRLLADNKPADVFVQDSGGSIDMMITGRLGSGREPSLDQREAFAEMAHACNLARVSWRQGERDTPETMLQLAPVAKISGPLRVELAPGAFLQPSAAGEEALVRAVMDPLRVDGARRIADLFCGSGTFAGPMLSLGEVRGAESEPFVVKAMQKAAMAAPGLTVELRNLFSSPLKPDELAGYDAAVFDPPRMGAKEQARELARAGVPLVVGISCNPATFVRDARLLAGGGYRLETMQVIDQFLWSSHIELAGVFRR